MFSLCILNWKRKKNVIKMVNNMYNFKFISEILISNGNKKHAVNIVDFINNEKIKIYNDFKTNKFYGLELRFINSLRAINDNIIIIDDDINIVESELNKLLEKYNENKDRIIGKWGRSITNGYKFKNIYKDVDVVLTKLLICKKKLINIFFICKPLIQDIYINGKPYGNGEDIFFSFISNIYLNQKGFCLNVETKDLPQMDCAISASMNHSKYRRELCNYLNNHKDLIIKFISNLKL